MKPVLQQSDGLWIGWSGETSGTSDEKRRSIIDGWSRQYGYFGVDLDSETAHGYYEGIANQVLWPLFHHFPSQVRFDPADWTAYIKANEVFRDEILKHLRPNDLVWIHDYHFLLLPQMLREAAPEVSIGFFLHVPFPSSSVFRVLPKREQILRGMLGADYLAFHTHRYLQHFRTSILRLLGLNSQMDRVEVDRRTVKLDALPIGIVNPYDEEGLSLAIGRALSLGESERRDRMMALYRRVHKNNVFAWSSRFIGNLCNSAQARSEQQPDEPVPLATDDLGRAFRQAKCRQILLDYDGTLVAFSTLPFRLPPY